MSPIQLTYRASHRERTSRRVSTLHARVRTPQRLLDLDDLFFFGTRGLIQLLHVGVGHLLDLVMRAAVVVLGDGFILEKLLHRFVAVTPDVAYRDAVILGHSMELLDQVLAALFGQRRNRDADQLSV